MVSSRETRLIAGEGCLLGAMHRLRWELASLGSRQVITGVLPRVFATPSWGTFPRVGSIN